LGAGEMIVALPWSLLGEIFFRVIARWGGT
jgi:hypothetical protein